MRHEIGGDGVAANNSKLRLWLLSSVGIGILHSADAWRTPTCTMYGLRLQQLPVLRL